ncbi:MAG TPA: hypothetical protein VNN55_06485 [bacterium]|nr:hypothetical protein [bacterium]
MKDRIHTSETTPSTPDRQRASRVQIHSLGWHPALNSRSVIVSTSSAGLRSPDSEPGILAAYNDALQATSYEDLFDLSSLRIHDSIVTMSAITADLQPISQSQELPARVAAYVGVRRLWGEIALSKSLVRKHFQNVWSEHFTMEADPESAEVWILHSFTTMGEVTDVALAHKEYSSEWTREVSWPKCDYIRLSFNIV